ncbi:MAG: phospholipid transport system substrate-binding protein [Candidatus Azotimanducaceae bacterium]|jgi:phospholipid transport system substrate-binding protein
MRQRIKIFLGLVLCWVVVLNAANAEVPDPKASVQAATDTLLAKLKEVKPLYVEDPAVFFDEIDQSLAPFVDFEGFSRSVMAKYYRRATDEEKAQFIQTFRKGLIKTYAKALVEFENETIIVLDPSIDPERPDRASIGLEIHGANSRVYPVEYSLVLVDNTWLLRNVVIEGINIGLQFRSQFAAYMRTYKNNIGEVIENWSVDAGS